MVNKTGTFRFQLREWYVYNLEVSALSAADAALKAEAFFTQHRKAARYQTDGVTAVLKQDSARVVHLLPSQSGWVRPQPAARDAQRDAAQAV